MNGMVTGMVSNSRRSNEVSGTMSGPEGKQERQDIPYFAVNLPYELVYRDNVVTNTVSAHIHNVTEIYLTMTDLPDVLLNDTVSKVMRGSLIIIPPFCVHQLYHRKNMAYKRYILNIDVKWMEYVLSESTADIDYMKNPQNPVIIPLEKEKLDVLLESLNRFLPIQAEHNMRTLSVLFELLSEMDTIVHELRRSDLQEIPLVVGSQKKVNDIIAFINENLMTGITVEQIAKHFYMNKDYLSRLFARHTHTTIGRYIAIQRIAKSQDLLRAGKTVMEVQEIMGYSSYSHFFKTFQKMTGTSPSRYRSQFC